MSISNQPIIFNIQYTPYKPPKRASEEEIIAQSEARAFYDMSGGKNVLKYITTDKKRSDKKTALEYLKKSTGVFNDKGMLTDEQVAEMKERLARNKGNIFHGFISLNKEESHKIDTPEKCVELIKHTFPQFLQEAGFHKDNIDLMCALHLDKPNHLHIHFVFWEKEPMYKLNDKSAEREYRRKGTLPKSAIDNMFVRLGLYLERGQDRVYKTRVEALNSLREGLSFFNLRDVRYDIKQAIVDLAKDLPKSGRLAYGSRDMEPFRERIDNIVQMILASNEHAREADKKFYLALKKREAQIKNICANKLFALVSGNKKIEHIQNDLPKYHNSIDENNIHIIRDIEYDYRRRQGNQIINLARSINPELFLRGRKRYKPNSKKMKVGIGISDRKITAAVRRFTRSFGPFSEMLEREYSNRLQEIEAEIEKERRKKEEGHKN